MNNVPCPTSCKYSLQGSSTSELMSIQQDRDYWATGTDSPPLWVQGQGLLVPQNNLRPTYRGASTEMSSIGAKTVLKTAKMMSHSVLYFKIIHHSINFSLNYDNTFHTIRSSWSCWLQCTRTCIYTLLYKITNWWWYITKIGTFLLFWVPVFTHTIKLLPPSFLFLCHSCEITYQVLSTFV